MDSVFGFFKSFGDEVVRVIDEIAEEGAVYVASADYALGGDSERNGESESDDAGVAHTGRAGDDQVAVRRRAFFEQNDVDAGLWRLLRRRLRIGLLSLDPVVLPFLIQHFSPLPPGAAVAVGSPFGTLSALLLDAFLAMNYISRSNWVSTLTLYAASATSGGMPRALRVPYVVLVPCPSGLPEAIAHAAAAELDALTMRMVPRALPSTRAQRRWAIWVALHAATAGSSSGGAKSSAFRIGAPCDVAASQQQPASIILTSLQWALLFGSRGGAAPTRRWCSAGPAAAGRPTPLPKSGAAPTETLAVVVQTKDGLDVFGVLLEGLPPSALASANDESASKLSAVAAAQPTKEPMMSATPGVTFFTFTPSFRMLVVPSRGDASVDLHAHVSVQHTVLGGLTVCAKFSGNDGDIHVVVFDIVPSMKSCRVAVKGGGGKDLEGGNGPATFRFHATPASPVGTLAQNDGATAALDSLPPSASVESAVESQTFVSPTTAAALNAEEDDRCEIMLRCVEVWSCRKDRDASSFDKLEDEASDFELV